MAPDLTLHPPRQARSRATLERICEAALALIAEKGVEGTTIADVVKRARTSVGSFYARFPGKTELLVHLAERELLSSRARWHEAVEAMEALPQGVPRLLGAIVTALDDVLLEATYPRASVGEDEGLLQTFLDDVRRLLLPHGRLFGHTSPERAIDTGYWVTVAALRAARSGEVAYLAALDRKERVEELSRLYLAHLAGTSVGPLEFQDPQFGDPFAVWD